MIANSIRDVHHRREFDHQFDVDSNSCAFHRVRLKRIRAGYYEKVSGFHPPVRKAIVKWMLKSHSGEQEKQEFLDSFRGDWIKKGFYDPDEDVKLIPVQFFQDCIACLEKMIWMSPIGEVSSRR
jgi:hypothetical protein